VHDPKQKEIITMIQKKIVVVGDWVEFIYGGGPYGDQFHEGGLYRVTAIHHDGHALRYSFALDDLGSKSNGLVAKNLRLASEQSPMNQGEYEAILADQDAYEALREN